MKSLKRILALLGVFFLLGLVVLTLIFAFTGSPYFMASLCCMIGLPVVIYGYMIIFRAFSGKNRRDRMQDSDSDSKDR